LNNASWLRARRWEVQEHHMKKTLLLAAAILSVTSAATGPSAFADPPFRGDDHDRRGDRDRHDEGRRDRDWRHDRSEWRDEHGIGRWDPQRHDGYWFQNRWYFGPPPQLYYGRPGFALGYRPWVRGAVLPRYYFDRPYYIDYRYYLWRRPPRGYCWVRDERGDFLLAVIATGLIADVIVNSR
jgi:Ni/Co efflux regulator RcnB